MVLSFAEAQMKHAPPPHFPELRFRLPGWIESSLPPRDHVYATVDERVDLAILLAQLNVKHATGGPFGAAVFDVDAGTLVAPGVNSVVPANCSAAHAEIIALSLSQRILATYNLGAPSMARMELVSSVEPCVMCLGALLWAGVRSLVCAARDEDARAVGFDEGPKPPDWVRALEERGVGVTRDVQRKRAADVLREYVQAGGPVYNGGPRSSA